MPLQLDVTSDNSVKLAAASCGVALEHTLAAIFDCI